MSVHEKTWWSHWVFALVRPVVTAVICTALVGCGSRPTWLTGRVTLDGQPLEGAMLKLFPLGSEGRTVAAQTDSSGRYRMEVSPHPLRVAISKLQVMRQEKDGDGMALVTKEIIPARYSDVNSSELSVTPAAGATTSADFALTTGR